MDTEEKPSSWRDALTSAWDAKATASDDSEATTPAPQDEETTDAATPDAEVQAQPTDETPAADGTRQRGADGKFLPKEAKPEATKPAKTAPTKAPDAKTAKGAPGVTPDVQQTAQPKPQAQASTVKAPAGWKPSEREAFAKAPPELQQAIDRREREFVRGMQEAAPHKYAAERFNAATQPYMGIVKAQGGDVHATNESLWQTYGALHLGTPQQKAALVASIISNYGIDPGHVAAVLQGQPPQGGQGQAGFDPNQLAAQIEQRIVGGIQAQQQQALNAHHARRLEDFAASHEFFEDLKPAMAKLIEAGIADDFEDAYAKAASLDADVSAAMRQREEAAQAKATMASTQRTRAASASLPARPPGAAGPARPEGIRGALELAYDKVAGNRR